MHDDPRNTQDPAPDLDRVAADIRDLPIDDATIADAAIRVRERLGAELTATGGASDAAIRDCSDIQALLPAFLRNEVQDARTLLIKDHTRSCVPCRRALKAARDGATAIERVTTATTWRMPRAVAAALIVGLLGASAWLVQGLRTVDGTMATIESIDGTLFAAGAEPSPITVGATLGAHDEVRTAKGSGAIVRLHDGSLVELAERTAMSVAARRGGTTIQLDRGNIIVQAAKQRDGHLYVATRDCLVSVTGTVFAVNQGTKGSRVSVIEGSVEVDYGSEEHRLSPGQQVSTHPSLGSVPVGDEIAWSRDVDRYLTMMNAIAAIGREIQENVPPPAPRASSRLLDLVPANTVVYGAVPNVGRSVADAYSIFQTRMQQNELLRSWWQDGHSSEDEARIDQAIGHLRELGDHIGDEIVFALQMGPDGNPQGVILMAEAHAPAQLRSFLDDVIARWSDDSDHVPFRVVDSPTALTTKRDMLLWIRDDGLLVAGLDRDLANLVSSDPGMRFAGTPFHDRIARAYDNGINWLFAADIDSLLAGRDVAHDGADRRAREAWQTMGLTDLEHILIEERTENDLSHKQAVFTFDQPRRGLASWLASPAPMTTLDFVSPEASIAGAFVVKNPLSMLDDLLDTLQAVEPDLLGKIEALEAEHGIRIRDDIARPLGGEIALALDGPLLPEPSWKLIVEVYEPGRLTGTIASLVNRLDVAARNEGEEGLELLESDRGGRIHYGLRHGQLELPVRWTLVDGYLIAGPNDSVLTNAILCRDSGTTLGRARILTDLFPQNGHANFSALAFHNVKNLLAGAADMVGARVPLDDAQKAALQDLTRDMSAELYYAYAEPDQITISGSGRGGLFGMDLSTLIRLQGILGLGDALGQGQHHQNGGKL